MWIKSYSVTIQMKATEQYFSVVLFNYAVHGGFTFETAFEILKCDHFNENLEVNIFFQIPSRVLSVVKALNMWRHGLCIFNLKK